MVQIRDRGYNLMITAFLVIGGVAFGLPALGETDSSDKIDDIGVLLVGLIALAWYRLGSARLQRSWVPLVLVVLAIASQLVGIRIESGDRQSLADNATGLFVFVPALGLGLWEYFRPFGGARLSDSGSAPSDS